MALLFGVIDVCCVYFPELKALLQYITGVSTVQGNNIVITFDPVPSGSITVNTCGRELQLSTHIVDEKTLYQEFDALTGERNFTMI